MTFKTTLPLVGAALLALPTVAAAQRAVVPRIATSLEGNTNQNRLFENNAFRAQQVVLGSYLTTAPAWAILDGIGYRPSSCPSGATFTDVVVRIGNTTQTPQSLTDDFSVNANGAMTTVYDTSIHGPIVVPPWTQPAGTVDPAPFFRINFKDGIGSPMPFFFDPNHADGPNLLIDIKSNVSPAATINVDGARAGGLWNNFGTSGPVSAPDFFRPFRFLGDGNSTNGLPGGNMAGLAPGDGYRLLGTVPAYLEQAPAAILFGPGAKPTPIELGIIGMPSNYLYTSSVGSVPAQWQFSAFGGWRIIQTIDNGANAPIGLQMNFQVAIVDLAANALGVVTSNGVETHIGESAANHPVGQVTSSDPAALTGIIEFGTTAGVWGGAVLEVFGPSF
ncbi:MAG: hypothetical protein KDB80_11550 [Planctomycetes bacterium]|nr:hypothetical protein [Planctomycetota bacterium]